MKPRGQPQILVGTALVFAIAIPVIFHAQSLVRSQNAGPPAGIPKREPEPYWTNPFPNQYLLGQVGGIYVDPKSDR